MVVGGGWYCGRWRVLRGRWSVVLWSVVEGGIVVGVRVVLWSMKGGIVIDDGWHCGG